MNLEGGTLLTDLILRAYSFFITFIFMTVLHSYIQIYRYKNKFRRQLTAWPFSKITLIVFPLGHIGVWPHFQHGIVEFLPVKKASNLVRNWLVTSITFMPILHQWAHLASHVAIWSLLLNKIIGDFSCQTACIVHLVLWKSASREDTFRSVPPLFFYIL